MDYSTLIEELTQSYTRQNEWYSQLTTLVQKILGQITLSRGDLSGVMPLFKEKQELLDTIIQERDRTKDHIEIWQKDKGNIPSNDSTERLDLVLQKTEKEIKAFLASEEQLKKYLVTLTGNGGKSTP